MNPPTTNGRYWWNRAYDVALHAFPHEFRERWARDMRIKVCAVIDVWSGFKLVVRKELR